MLSFDGGTYIHYPHSPPLSARVEKLFDNGPITVRSTVTSTQPEISPRRLRFFGSTSGYQRFHTNKAIGVDYFPSRSGVHFLIGDIDKIAVLRRNPNKLLGFSDLNNFTSESSALALYLSHENALFSSGGVGSGYRLRRDTGCFKVDEARVYRDRSILKENPTLSLQHGDRFLISNISDGSIDSVTAASILRSDNEPKMACEHFIDHALLKSGLSSANMVMSVIAVYCF